MAIPSELTADQLAGLMKALSDENRLKIVGLLAQRSRYGEELAELLELSPPTISHHLSRLREAGLVRARKEPPYTRYRLEPDVLPQLAQCLDRAAAWPQWMEVPNDDAVNERVLRSLLDEEGRLTEVPATRRKRTVLLRWLAHRFETGRIYPEREVRRLLMEVSPHFEQLRSYLVDEGWMQQQGGVYRRLEEAEET